MVSVSQNHVLLMTSSFFYKVHHQSPLQKSRKLKIHNGLEILKNISKEYLTIKTPVSMFSKDIIIENKPYVITYMSPEIYIAGISMRDNYVKRIMSRRVEKKSS